MATAKKKLDEYHLKILRQLVTFPSNKECFDCHQRGPTYVNVTIGSFVCTTCSGMLRGLTPPHRVKSISMATFTPEEIEFVTTRGNDYCRRTWLGLLDAQQPTRDEEQVKEFMISKYEKKRYFLDPAIASTINRTVNGNASSPGKPAATEGVRAVPTLPCAPVGPTHPHQHPATLAFKAPTRQTNGLGSSGGGVGNAFTPEPFADFSGVTLPPPTDPFNSRSSQAAAAPAQPPSATALNSYAFADFDNNPVFSNSSSTASLDVWTDLSSLSPPIFKVPLRPMSGRASCPPTNRWSESATVPLEDKYAALKDLDCLMKSQQQATEPHAEWSSGGQTNGVNNVWSTPSLFQNSTNETKDTNSTSNPFKGASAWNTTNNNVGANPFRNTRQMNTDAVWNHLPGQMPNGFTTSQSLNFASAKVPWNNEAFSNPFMCFPPSHKCSLHFVSTEAVL